MFREYTNCISKQRYLISSWCPNSACLSIFIGHYSPLSAPYSYVDFAYDNVPFVGKIIPVIGKVNYHFPDPLQYPYGTMVLNSSYAATVTQIPYSDVAQISSFMHP